MRPYSPDRPWRLDASIRYLNHGSFGACPVPVLEYQAALRERMEANPVAFLWRDHDGLFDEARAVLASFLHADPEGLVFVPNATTGVSTVLRSLAFEPGDELLTTDHEYNATLNALDAVARAAGATVRIVQLALPIVDPGEVVAALVAAVTPRTRLALVSHVTSPTGLVLPIEAIVRALRERGVDTLVDAAHAPGMVPVDLGQLAPAYWTANGHKWLCGPKGSAVLVVRDDRRDRVQPLVVSHGYNDPVARPRLWKEFDWTGTSDPTPFLGLARAVEVVEGLHAQGWTGVMEANHALAVEARAILHDALRTDPVAPESMIGSMVAVALPGRWTDGDADHLKDALTEEDRIEVPVMGWPVLAARDDPRAAPSRAFVRISAQLYNERSDYVALAESLARRLAPAIAGAAR